MRLLESLLLRWCSDPISPNESVETGQTPLNRLLRVYPELLATVQGKAVLDFGCGLGAQAVALAEAGAKTVVGVDINPELLRRAQELSEARGTRDRVRFVTRVPEGESDFLFSLNSMEHFPEPEKTMAEMVKALAPNGVMLISFSPPWYAPYGAHMHYFTRLPWVHLYFPERVVMAVRRRYRSDNATRYEDVEGGLNRMSIRKFKRIVKASGLRVQRLTIEPVKGQRFLAGLPFIGEMFSNEVTAVLVK